MKKIIILYSLLLPAFLFAQETIDAQRPTLSESYTIVEKNIIQFENGFIYTNPDTYNYGSFVRFGVNKRIELRILKMHEPSFQIGGKVALFEGKNLLPGVSILMGYDPIYHNQDYKLAFSGKKGKFFYTINGANNGLWYGIGLVGLSFGKLNTFAEYQIDQSIQQQFNGGLTYIIKGEVQLDVHGGAILNDAESDPFIGCGVSFRVK